ncbi:MAG: glycosyltransferase family 2 protein, partial [Pseudomonadota bacterium]
RMRPKLRQLAPVVLLLGSVGGVLLSPIAPITLLAPMAYAGLLLMASIWGWLSTGSVCGLLAGLAAATMHMSWAIGFLRQLLRRR